MNTNLLTSLGDKFARFFEIKCPTFENTRSDDTDKL